MDATLLLNASYEPLTVVPWTRAVTLVTAGKADIADTHDHMVLRSAGGLQMPMPTVVRLRRYVRFRLCPRVPTVSRARVLERDRHRCVYCAAPADTLDHVVPRGQGGPSTWANLVACCRPCNQHKGARTPDEVGWDWPAAGPPTPTVPGMTKIPALHPAWVPYLTAATPVAV